MSYATNLKGCLSVLLGTLTCCLASQQPSKAQQPPPCRSISNPTPGTVCYTEHPFSQRQRDEGGTREWPFILERWAGDWVIVDWRVIRDGGFGTVSNPTGSIVSSNGNANIISTTRRSIQELMQVKNRLEGKYAGCAGPGCFEIKNTLDSLSREISQLENITSSAVSAGGNEKIRFMGTTYVNCYNINYVFGKKRVCEGGASLEGRVLLYQRYLGNTGQIQASTSNLLNQANTVLNKPLNPPPSQNPGSYPPPYQGGGTYPPPTQTNQCQCAPGEAPLACIARLLIACPVR